MTDRGERGGLCRVTRYEAGTFEYGDGLKFGMYGAAAKINELDERHPAPRERVADALRVLRIVEKAIEDDDWHATIDDQAHEVCELVQDEVRKAIAGLEETAG